MYLPGAVIYFTPFYFQDGSSKNKYFLVLATDGACILLAGLPTSKDHIPSSIKKEHGCINDELARVNCYFFQSGVIISECGTFGFPRDTYLYGEQITLIDANRMRATYPRAGTSYTVLCRLSEAELHSIRKCLKDSGTVKRKYKNYL